MDKIWYRKNPQKCRGTVSFIKTGTAKTMLYLQVSINSIQSFHIYCPIWVTSDTSHLYTPLFSICDFHENQRRKAVLSLQPQQNYIYACTMKLYDIFKVMKTLVKSVRYIGCIVLPVECKCQCGSVLHFGIRDHSS